MKACGNTGADIPTVAVLVFGDRWAQSSLAGLPTHRAETPADVDAAISGCRRLVVVGADADLATVLTRLLRTDRLDIEVAYAPPRR
ncbi:MAG TPA: peptidase M50, partial [Mycobacterium sp.]|nr:peptidase M50 [Mycobacterium sp.]